MRIIHITALCLLFFVQMSALCQHRAGAPKIRFVTYNKKSYLYLADVAAFYGMKFAAKDKRILLSSRYSQIELAIDSRVMNLNDVQVHLSLPIAKNGKILLIGKSDFLQILEPVLRPRMIPRRTVKTIVIDPGHGGKDSGAVSGKTYEKDINLQVALRLAKKLHARGFKVCMTRNKDAEISLDNRVKFAKDMKADVYVSIHCNSASSNVAGTEIYISTPAGDAPTGDNVVSPKACPANAYNKDNAYLAYYTLRGITQRTQAEDRGLRRRRFYVIRNVTCPSILVEMGYLSNAKELALLKQPIRQEQIAMALADGISRYSSAVK